ncbi:MAG: Uma2 family endonuclease [Elainellaceae cyanobacterium]
MYDLPSEFPEEPGLPDVGASPSRDEYHILQPQLLARSLSLTAYTRNQWFSGSDLNLYYDPSHPLWHKRPDWFLAVGVPRLYDGHDLRRSYVVWQEGTAPTVAVEFLSLGTEASDLGRFYTANDAIAPNEAAQQQSKDSTPDKLTVYEQFLQVPHYLVYSRHQQRLRYFQLVEGQYQEQTLNPQRPTVWLADLGVGLGLWKGKFEGASGLWLRWCDAQGQWLLTDTEQAQQQRAARLAQRLRDIGIDPDTE